MRFVKLIVELVKKGKENGDKNSIQNCLKNSLMIAQIFGLMPVSGITGGKAESVRFLWVSFRTAYALLRIIGALFLIVLQILRMTYEGSSLGEYRLLMFYIGGFSSAVNFFLLARRWPMIIRKWHFLEFLFSEYGWPNNLNMTINSFLIVYLSAAFERLWWFILGSLIESSVFLALYLSTHPWHGNIFLVEQVQSSRTNYLVKVEHLLEDIHKISLIHSCGLDFPSSVDMFLKHFILKDVFNIINYTFIGGILLEIMSLLLTFSWTYIDIFIILISWCLAERFRQITQRVKFLMRTRVSDEKKWEKVRTDYSRLCQLCRLLDHELSFIILQSFASNMFFILTQLFNSFQYKGYLMENLYFCFSFFTLILRMFFVCVIAGKIYEESSKPLAILSEAPTDIYNLQIQRFAEYIHWNNISLTGRRYFVITKGLLLNITGAIITYELVLLQFEGRHSHTQNKLNETYKFFTCDNF